MTVQEILDEVARRTGNTNSTFVSSVLLPAFNFVVAELAQAEAISALTRTRDIAFLQDGTRAYSTRTVTGLVAPLYPLQINRITCYAWGAPRGRIVRVSEDEMRDARLIDGESTSADYITFWCVYPNEQQLLVHPVPNAVAAGATFEVEYVAPPASLAAANDIVEISYEHLPALCAGLYRYGILFQDETLNDKAIAEQLWRNFVGMMRHRKEKARTYMRDVRIRFRDF